MKTATSVRLLAALVLALYADPRGLRNEIAQGTMSSRSANAAFVNWLIHTFFVFGIWSELAENHRSAD